MVADKELEKLVEKYWSIYDFVNLKTGKKGDLRAFRNFGKACRDYGGRKNKLYESQIALGKLVLRQQARIGELTAEKPSLFQRLTAFFRKEGKLPRNFKENEGRLLTTGNNIPKQALRPAGKPPKADWDNPQVKGKYMLSDKRNGF